MKIINTIGICSTALICSCNTPTTNTSFLNEQQKDFPNLINIKNAPSEQHEYDLYLFSDLGAWSGYALPENESSYNAGAFIGPMVMTGRGWLAQSLAEPDLSINGKKFDFARNIQTSEYLPGKLIQTYKNGNLKFVTELCFATSRSAVVRSTITNLTEAPLNISLKWKGGVFEKTAKLDAKDNQINIFYPFYKYGTKENDKPKTSPVDNVNISISFNTAENVVTNGKDSLFVNEKNNYTLEPGKQYQSSYIETLVLKDEDINKEKDCLSNISIDECFIKNETRWNGYITKLMDSDSPYMKENSYRNIAVKAMMTLNSNWRSSAGDILRGCSFPSYVGFIGGCWSWDAWQIASGNVLYNPEGAKSEMLALFDYQADNGMVPDFINYNKKRNNWRDSKPPVASWGAMNVYKATGDKKFLEEIFDKLYKFHNWWYNDRDHNKNGICEYGSTDGSLIAAAWESGMDNGVRFDDTEILNNGRDDAWSMNQESICLNSFLYIDKKLLAEMASILGKNDIAEKLNKDAEFIKEYVQKNMYDEETGFFYDVKIDSEEKVKVMGAEGWLPLWAGIATKEQAESVKQNMMNENHFNSHLPLGTLDISHPALRPTRGYWRGPVWFNQVYFGIIGLKNYGYEKEADYLTRKFMNNAQGLMTDGPIHENYNPLTGEALNAPNFGWSSALILKLLVNK